MLISSCCDIIFPASSSRPNQSLGCNGRLSSFDMCCHPLETLLPGGVETSGQRVYCLNWLTRIQLIFRKFYPFFGFDIFWGFGVIANQPTVHRGKLAGGGSVAAALVTGDR